MRLHQQNLEDEEGNRGVVSESDEEELVEGLCMTRALLLAEARAQKQ